MEDMVNIGVVGCGYWGPNLIRNFRGLPGCRLKLICDTKIERLKHLTTLYPEVEAEHRFDVLLNGAGLDAIAIATPVHLHYKLAKACLLAGKHTFIEKPMASSSKECAELVELARVRRLTLMVGHTFLYSPAVRKIQEIIASGDIGEIRYISARRLNLGLFQKDINVVWDLAPHDISIILQLMGEQPSAVNCQGRATVSNNIEDVSSTTLVFKNGFANIHNSWLDPRKVREMTIVGTKKMIVYDDMEPLQKIKIFDERVESPPHYDTYAEFQFAYHYGDMQAPYIKQEEPLKLECQHFLDCIRNGTTPLSCGTRGLELVRILEAASRSLKKNGARVYLRPAPAREMAAVS
jgi:predicted dehydrogenase